MDEERPPPDAAAIRRALAECMTLNDVDDAMGWATGTARRRRWRDPDAGGLPPADAELGGVPLWFRATISGWRARASAPPLPDEIPQVDTGPVPDPGGTAEETRPAAATGPDGEPAGAEVGSEADGDGDDDTHDDGINYETETGEAPVDLPAARIEVGEPQIGPGRHVDTGFALAAGQEVLAFVSGKWQPAVVAARGRRTVVVDYQVGSGPLGARRQRVALDRIRLPER